MSEPTMLPSPSGSIRFEISVDTLNNLSRAFYKNPSLISQYTIDPTSLNSGIYDKVFDIYNQLAAKGCDAISGMQIDEILKSGSYTEVEKNGLRDYFALHAGSSEESLNNCVSNINMYYEEFRKQYILMSYQNAGIDISDYWPLDKKYIRPNGTPDIDKMEEAKKRYEQSSADGIVNAIMDRYSRLMKSPDANLKHSTTIKLYRGRQLPGGDKEIDYLIGEKAKNPSEFDNGWMELGSFNSIVAAAKAGKTQLAMQMAFCVQNGIPFFGYPVKQSDVLYVDYELRPNQIHKRLEMLEEFYRPELDDAGIIEAEDPYYISVSELFSKGEINMDGIIRSIRESKETNPNIRMIFFDCFYTFMEGDANAEDQVKNCLLKLKSLVDDNTTVIYVHHTNKTGTKGMSDLDMIYAAGGSGVHGKIVDTTYVARPHKGSAIEYEVYATGRSCSGEKVICDKSSATKFFFKRQDETKRMKNEITTEEKTIITPYEADLRDKFNTLKKLKDTSPDLYNILITKEGQGFDSSDLGNLKMPDKMKEEYLVAKASSRKVDKNILIYNEHTTALRKFALKYLGLWSYRSGQNIKFTIFGNDIKSEIPDVVALESLLDSKDYENRLSTIVAHLIREKYPEFFEKKDALENSNGPDEEE